MNPGTSLHSSRPRLKQRTATIHPSWDSHSTSCSPESKMTLRLGSNRSWMFATNLPRKRSGKTQSEKKCAISPSQKNGYFIRVAFEKKTGRWQTKKVKGKKLIRSAFGSSFDMAMIHTTMDEP